MVYDETYQQLEVAVLDAAELVEKYNDQAEVGQKITHQSQMIPHFATLIFQQRMSSIPLDSSQGPGIQ